MMNIIDIGSNSVRIMYRRNGETVKELTSTKLGRGLTETGRLCAESVDRTLDALEKYVAMGECVLFATEAVRKATNREEFLSEVRRRTGKEVDVLTGEEEAACAFFGASAGRRCAVTDIGGASTELVRGSDGVEKAVSLPMGAVVLTDRFGTDVDKLNRFAEELLKKADFALSDEPLVGIGGTITTLAAVDAKLKVYDPKIVNGYVLSLKTVENLIEKLASMSSDDRKKVDGLPASRADIIVAGSVILRCVMTGTGRDVITVSESDNTEGYAVLRGINYL